MAKARNEAVMDDVVTPTTPDPSAASAGGVVGDALALPDSLDGFRRWAMTLFALLLILIAVGVALLGSVVVERPLMEVLVAFTGVAISAAALLAVLTGLYRRHPWAIPAAVWACWVIVAAAIVRVTTDLAHGNITIPLEGIGAVAVLTRRPTSWPALSARDRQVAVLVTLLFVASEAWPVLVDAVRSGQAFGASSDALALMTAVTCSDLSDVNGDRQADRVIATTATWTWSQSEFLAGGNDGMLVHWVADSSDGTSWEPVLVSDDLDAQGPAIWRGLAGPSLGMLQGSQVGVALEVGIDVGARGLATGTVHATVIAGTNPPPAHGSVSVWADYAHLDRWRITSDPVTCTW